MADSEDYYRADKSTAGLLATNKQFYEETHGIYWSANNFHLARGDYRNSQAFFENISPEHIALIEDITIDISLADLTPQLLQHLERMLLCNDLRGRLFRDDSTGEWGFWASMLLRSIWKEKICWVQKRFNHVPHIFIVCFEDPKMVVRYHGNQLEDEITGFCERRDQPQETSIGSILQWAIKCADDRVRYRVQQIGWDNFKEELAAGGWGRRKNVQWCSEPSKIRY